MKNWLKFDGNNYFLNDKILTPERSLQVINHSPDGFNHGYGGSGPSQLALAIMLELTGSHDGYRELKNSFIANLPQNETFNEEFTI